MSNESSQYVVFLLDREKYGVNILNVGTISEYLEITPMPNAENYIEGLINLRGSIIPIINLKTKFKLTKNENTNETKIIIYSVNESDMGFLVDEVVGVIDLDGESVENMPEIIKGIDRDYISGVGKHENEIIILINPERILTDIEQNRIQKMM